MSPALDVLHILPLARGSFLHWGVFSISLANLVVIVVMVLVFVVALVAPFPHRDRTADDAGPSDGPPVR